MSGSIGQIIVITIVCIFLFLIFGVWPFIGHVSKTLVVVKELPYHSCDITKFEQDYGVTKDISRIFLDERDFFITSFSTDWIVPIDAITCRIIEDENGAFQRFQIYDYDFKISNIPENFYDSTMECVKTAKGASTTCDVVININRVLDAPITNIIATLPTQASEDIAAELVKRGWKETARNFAGVTSRVVKTVRGATFSIGLDIVEETSCPLKDTPKKIIFDLSNEANQYFVKAKHKQYSSDTIAKLTAFNEYIITFESMKIDINKNLIRAFIDWIIGTVSEIQDPQCSPEKQLQKFQNHQQKVSESESAAQSLLTQFTEKLLIYKNNAINAINLEKGAKEKNTPNIFQWFIITKTIQYYLEPSESYDLFNNQLYISAEEAAKDKVEFYNHFWENIELVDYLFSVFIWFIIAFIIFLIIRLFIE